MLPKRRTIINFQNSTHLKEWQCMFFSMHEYTEIAQCPQPYSRCAKKKEQGFLPSSYFPLFLLFSASNSECVAGFPHFHGGYCLAPLRVILALLWLQLECVFMVHIVFSSPYFVQNRLRKPRKNCCLSGLGFQGSGRESRGTHMPTSKVRVAESFLMGNHICPPGFFFRCVCFSSHGDRP